MIFVCVRVVLWPPWMNVVLPLVMRCLIFSMYNQTSDSISLVQNICLYILLLANNNRGVHELGWVRLRGFFDPTHHGGSKKNSTQPNPSHKSNSTQMGQVGLGWIHRLDKFIIIIIIIKLSKKNKYKYIKKKTQRLVSM